MRRTVFVIVGVLMAGFCAGLNAQIPEGAQFQPGSYAVPYHRPMVAYPMPIAVAPQADDSRTEWEKQFSPQTTVAPIPMAPQPPPYVYPTCSTSIIIGRDVFILLLTSRAMQRIHRHFLYRHLQCTFGFLPNRLRHNIIPRYRT
jgi:hypothetical protein